MNTKRYIWDLDTELEALRNNVKLQRIVTKYPSIGSLEIRRKLAVNFVKSTEHSTYEWIDDRACPYTENANIILGKNLLYPDSVFGLDNTPKAFGTVSPIASEIFYNYVDEILIEGGWEHGAENSIYNRINPCPESGFINRSSVVWESNPYYDDIVEWHENDSNVTGRLRGHIPSSII